METDPEEFEDLEGQAVHPHHKLPPPPELHPKTVSPGTRWWGMLFVPFLFAVVGCVISFFSFAGNINGSHSTAQLDRDGKEAIFLTCVGTAVSWCIGLRWWLWMTGPDDREKPRE